MRTINATQLKRQLDSGTDLLLINALEPPTFQQEHIPGSRNVPNSAENFVDRVTHLADGKDQPVVVYCSSKDCKASDAAARKLVEVGFANVTHFAGGMAGWKDAGYEIVRGTPTASRS